MVILVDKLLFQIHLRSCVDIAVLILFDLFHGKLVEYFHFSLRPRRGLLFVVILSQLVLVVGLVPLVLDDAVAGLSDLDVVDSTVSFAPDYVAVAQIVSIFIHNWTTFVRLLDEIEGTVKLLWICSPYVRSQHLTVDFPVW